MELKYIVVALVAAVTLFAVVQSGAFAFGENVSIETESENTCDFCCGGNCASCCSEGYCSRTGVISTTSGCGCGR